MNRTSRRLLTPTALALTAALFADILTRYQT